MTGHHLQVIAQYVRWACSTSGMSGVRCALLLACVVCCGCEPLHEEYGSRNGNGAKSVNGTSVFADMFADRGDKVSTWQWLSPRLKKADVIVWFPDDCEPPKPEVQDWFENWLWESEERILIYVGRDFDAAIDYWEMMKRGAGPTIRREIYLRQSASKSNLQEARNTFSGTQMEVPWFTVDTAAPSRSVNTIEGNPEWTRDIVPNRLEIELNTRLVSPEEADVLLSSESDVLVSRQWFGDSQLIVVTNGSFLLNLPLVNHEHRKLASKLIDECGDSRRVVFLESGQGGPLIMERDPRIVLGGLTSLGVWPLNMIFLHLAALGLIYAFWKYPIFGAARDPDAVMSFDFGAHLEAVGELLEHTRDAQYAKGRIELYQQLAYGEPPRRGRRAPPAESAPRAPDQDLTP